MARRKISRLRKGARQEQNDARAQTLAAGAEQMFRGSLEDGMTCPNQAAQVSEQGFKICLYRLE
jgi:radical SAM superfamily enzyme